MKIILTGGGTAGHINPAISVADALCRVGRETASGKPDILFVGTERGMENTLTAQAGYPIWHIDVSGFERRLSLKNIESVFKVVRSLRQADEIIEKFRPDAVFGTGGYVCYPILHQAAKSKRRIFTALHESNASAGLAVRMLSDSVDRVYLNFENTKKDMPKLDRVRVVGMPVRNSVMKLSRERARELLGIGNPIVGRESEFGSGRSNGKGIPIGSFRYVILSFGGSLGAKTINSEMMKLMNVYDRMHPEVLHIHSCGKNEYAEFLKFAEENGVSKLKNVIINEFIYDMPLWLAASDVVICRSGAATVSELAAVGRASILIPSPNVVGDHQYENAKILGDAGAAFVIREKSDELRRIGEFTETILSDRKLRENMELCASKTAVGIDAAEVIAHEIIERVEG